MRLLIDAGNTRLKWCLDDSGRCIGQGAGAIDHAEAVAGLSISDAEVTSIAVSTVASEERRLSLLSYLSERFEAPVSFYWAEAQRNGLKSAYEDSGQMGADRWHAMYGAWQGHRKGFVVVDAGSAITVDYVAPGGCHLGGFILPGMQMMRRSLQVDAARVDFAPMQVSDMRPGSSTSECVNHGFAWLSGALIDRVHKDSKAIGVSDILVTGGDAEKFLRLGLKAKLYPVLVLDGLALIDAEADPG
ncbi:type III pantothenate kinase [Marinobacter salexigens]|uniref:type III pantothenate kinase n=1 Tax=Marinobacter salexigens TaxID=1925763 RepID=UPI000C2947BD|nr:type III pantothenate kinase [Marinobacter salexigens]